MTLRRFSGPCPPSPSRINRGSSVFHSGPKPRARNPLENSASCMQPPQSSPILVNRALKPHPVTQRPFLPRPELGADRRQPPPGPVSIFRCRLLQLSTGVLQIAPPGSCSGSRCNPGSGRDVLPRCARPGHLVPRFLIRRRRGATGAYNLPPAIGTRSVTLKHGTYHDIPLLFDLETSDQIRNESESGSLPGDGKLQILAMLVLSPRAKPNWCGI